MTDNAPLDVAALRGWIGRTDRATDIVTPRLAQGLLATLDQDGPALAEGQPVPATAHWCLTQPTVPMSRLGPDGHPARGGFLPPVPLPRRMWAGGALEFREPLRVGDAVERESRIADVAVKEGRTGTLCFVAVEHRISTPRGLAILERQDIVYRDMDRPQESAPAAASPPPSPDARQPRWRRVVQADPVLLFRYSALTFNGHRIHYDRPYCIEAEGYSGPDRARPTPGHVAGGTRGFSAGRPRAAVLRVPRRTPAIRRRAVQRERDRSGWRRGRARALGRRRPGAHHDDRESRLVSRPRRLPGRQGSATEQTCGGVPLADGR